MEENATLWSNKMSFSLTKVMSGEKVKTGATATWTPVLNIDQCWSPADTVGGISTYIHSVVVQYTVCIQHRCKWLVYFDGVISSLDFVSLWWWTLWEESLPIGCCCCCLLIGCCCLLGAPQRLKGLGRTGCYTLACISMLALPTMRGQACS